jgi:hypothetical protein
MNDTFNFFWSSLRVTVEQVFWDHCRSIGHIVVTSAMFLEEVQHNSCGVLQASQFYYPGQGASGGDERTATTCRQLCPRGGRSAYAGLVP